MPPPPENPSSDAIAERVRGILLRNVGPDIAALSKALALPEAELQRFMERPGSSIDVATLVDILGALVRSLGVDPHWLLTGSYDATSHRQVLELLEAGEGRADARVREDLREKLLRLRAGIPQWSSQQTDPSPVSSLSEGRD